jgi:serine/threonine protein phosphatase PrpC
LFRICNGKHSHEHRSRTLVSLWKRCASNYRRYFIISIFSNPFVGFKTLDKSFLDLASKKGYKDGSCAVVCLWLRDEKKLVLGNLGDSRAVICRKGKAVALTNDHRPTASGETERIISKSGSIPPNGRLFNIFSISRALGDKDFKIGPLEGILSAEPDVFEVSLTSSDYFIILASDGFWDVISNDEAIVLTVLYFSRFSVYNLGKVTKELVNEAVRRGSLDDITVLLLLLQPPIPK